jgi:hypothetical protein
MSDLDNNRLKELQTLLIAKLSRLDDMERMLMSYISIERELLATDLEEVSTELDAINGPPMSFDHE